MGFLLWCILLVLCWPLALLALVLYPIVWLILLPFRLLGIAVDGSTRVSPNNHYASGSNSARASSGLEVFIGEVSATAASTVGQPTIAVLH